MIMMRKFERENTILRGIIFHETRELFESECGAIDENTLPTVMKKVKEIKVEWSGFNNNPDFDKNFPLKGEDLK